MPSSPSAPPTANDKRSDSRGQALRVQLSRWWRRLSPSRQDRIATFGPLLSVLLFLAAIVSAFWYLRYEENEREAEAVQRDAEIVQQQLRSRLNETQDALTRIARSLRNLPFDTRTVFVAPAAALIAERPELTHLAWIGPNRERRAVQSDRPFHLEANPDGRATAPTLPTGAMVPGQTPLGESEATFERVKTLRTAQYSGVFLDALGSPAVQLHVPLMQGNDFAGALIAQISLERLLRAGTPADVLSRHTVQIATSDKRELISNAVALPGLTTRQPTHEAVVPLAPMANGLMLRSLGWRTSLSIVGNTLFWMVLALSGLSLWMLLGTWGHMRRRSQMQATLVKETNFRRAMENSMLTGMRAMDREGRITYVNPAFCAMTGFADHELVGKAPPYPFWPVDAVEENSRLLNQELEGRSPVGGIEVRLARKDGSGFDARMYVSPLVDSKGHQTGWMTSVTNITEAKRIRDQLSASHERFTTVLEGLDAVVSVMSVQQGELLFANRTYRHWFGAEARGHSLLAGTPLSLPELPSGDEQSDDGGFSGLPAQALADLGAAPREVYVPKLQVWFDVRARYLQWTDGRLAQMLIATDVTVRRQSEELARQQAEKAQVTSRLVTMGEMASSVAHELNQPLTAITNYCNGMVSRVRSRSIGDDDLIAALEKTARQAERAGQVIRRIRTFVKRSEPQRVHIAPAVVIEDAVELADIEMKRRDVRLDVYVAKSLPDIACDPILIEQVVLNLVKNAAEAIDAAALPQVRRRIELRVMPLHTDEGGMIEFSVTDTGPGIREDVLARLYEAFFSTKAEGLGIGLSLCRSIVESHRGRIKGQNLYNEKHEIVGCRFSFTLPVETTVETRAGEPRSLLASGDSIPHPASSPPADALLELSSATGPQPHSNP
jgi:PAS domain S-box-containing protein